MRGLTQLTRTRFAVLLTCLLPLQCGAATIVINNLDAGTGSGFDDPTPVSPVTGNPGTTLGAQRLNVFEAAANDWAATLVSDVTIVVDAEMVTLDCDATSAILGSAGPNGSIFRNFAGVPSGIWYVQALRNAIVGDDGNPAAADVFAQFNSDVDLPDCLGDVSWSYVIGGAHAAQTVALYETVLHELAHGLGFLTLVDLQTGALQSGFSDAFTHWLIDETPSPTSWESLSNAGRTASAKDEGNLTWDGASVASVAGLLATGRHPTSGRVEMYARDPLEPGSSVSHFETALSPNELMEPILTADPRRRLTNHLMLDLGWHEMVALALTKTDGRSTIAAGSATTYTMTITNNGPADVSVVGATVADTMPAALNAVTWTCGGSGGASCGAANGAGDIDTTVTVPLAGVITFTVDAVVDPSFTGNLSNTVTVTLPANLQNTVSSSATDSTTVTGGGPVPGVNVSTISGNTTEAGGTATFTAVLDSQPSDDVTIGLSSSDTSEGTVSPGQFVFTAGNWSTPQQATVTGVDDAVDDGDVGYSIVTAPAVSADPGYNGLNPADVAVTNTDDDTAGFTVSVLSGNTTEAGGTATFTIRLNSEPTADVTIGLSSSDTTEGTVSPGQFVFTAGDWSTPQQATVTGVDDDLEDGDIGYSIVTAPAVSGDGKYNGLDPANVSVTNTDNDLGDFIFGDGFEEPN